ncbi:acyl-CoA dehydrogenase, middle domain protein [Dictyocaulus viviparus]|uniref:Acyl-coenzyme A oxidase n=1 Tax=Dictyocaulus viviparus TaxID=29172 RepID=A0A0D8Y4V0_DICVI|nr:acyl-CoA dehydrogenase, middle domain protein [Dictyocaulus viviparus]
MISPLDSYRLSASFDVRELKNVIEGEENVQTKKRIYETLEKEPLFARSNCSLTLEQHRELNHRRWKRILQLNLPVDQYGDLQGYQCLMEVLETYDQGLSARLTLHSSIVGCFCLTELTHGSNTQDIQTTAAFDNGEFVFNCPNDGAIKCWAGNLAHSATHAVVFAQLMVGGKCEGVHAFLLQIRDMCTFNPLPGITIGDMGAKPGAWNGVENGWMEFKNHRAPLWTLLNKGCDVTPVGSYVSSYKSVSEKQSVSLGALSVGRIGIIGKGIIALGLASTIAIRYSACRKQFGPTKGEEIPIIEYPLQRHRLLPNLAAYFAVRIFQKRLWEHFTSYIMRVMQGDKSDEVVSGSDINQADFSKEIHALSSAAKPVATWLGVAALSEARRSCGGHGFLHCSRLNELHDSFDPSQTFEGENNMIIQQTSNILLAKVRSYSKSSPMKTFDFLNENSPPFKGEFSANIVEDVADAYKWIIRYYLNRTIKEYEAVLDACNGDAFAARNHTQVHRAHTLSIAYAELTIVNWSSSFVEEVVQPQIKQVLHRLITLYALSALDKHLASCYISGYCSGEYFGERIRSNIRQLEAELASDAIALVDAIAPPDFVLNSALGFCDGLPYKHLMLEFRKYTNNRPCWLKDLSDFLKENAEASKL